MTMMLCDFTRYQLCAYSCIYTTFVHHLLLVFSYGS